MHHKSKGITLIGFVIVLVVAGFFAYVAMKLIPAYTEYFGVVKSMDQLSKEPGVASKSLDQLRRDLGFKFSTQYVDEQNVPLSSVTAVRDAGKVILRTAYERRIPFMYNVDLLVSFDHSINLTSNTGE
ncbi:MAG: DUF4845 domain-containing protein [Flavobacteriales bacterium]|uniref:DUF4845 domain-containing protein n=1 Tax=Dokdonella sp. TaxID=2291710 RepID=UPI001D925738|nr:DUF4845 domain-containing protein [Dokdonella sp.]MBZ0205302.1 DUF4845 domain-containing protein [Flavobacteriales bacterium]